MLGNDLELEGLKNILALLIKKKTFLEEELVKAYDSNKRFSIENDVQNLNKQIQEQRNKIDKLTLASSTSLSDMDANNDKKAKKVFFSYSRKDRALLEELQRHLKVFQRQGKILPWDDHEVLPGEQWDNRIKANLESADIVLMLLSADFLATDYIWDVEIPMAIQLQKQKKTIIVPIILRPCSWEESPLGKYNGLPRKGLNVTTSFKNRDEAWLEVVQGLSRIL